MPRLHLALTRRTVLKPWLPISLILLLATGLYLYRLEYRGLWIDELISIKDAQEVGFNRGRLLYYVLLQSWMSFGDSDAWLRGLAVLFAIAAVALIYQLGCNLFTKPVGLIAAFMLALSPLFINHAQEVRYYTMSVALGVAGTLALVQSLDQPTHHIKRFLWVIFRVLSSLTTPLNAALLVPDLTIITIKYRRQYRQLFRFFITFLLLVIMLVPAAISVKESAGAHRLSLPTPGLNNVLRELRILTAFSHPPPPPYMTSFLQIYILLILAILIIAVIGKRQSEKLQWLVAWTFIPTGIILGFSHLIFSIWNTRYVMLVLPYLLILIAVGFLEVWSRWRSFAWGITLIYTIAVTSGLFYYYTHSSRYMGASDHYRPTIEILNNHDQPGDVIVWSTIHDTALPLEHYYQGTARIYLKPPLQVQDNDTNGKREDIETWLSDLPDTSSRLWIFLGPGNPKDDELFHDVVEDKFSVEDYQSVGRFDIFLLNLR